MMKKIADLMKKHRETIVYIIVGVVVAAVNWGVYSLLTSVGGVDVNISNAISICCAFLLAFFLNKIVVFQKKEWKYDVVAKEFLAFFLSRLFTAIIEWGTVPVMQLLKIDFDLFGIEAGVAKLTGSVLGTVLNYFLSKFIVFRKKKTDTLTVLLPFFLVLFIPINAEASIKSEALDGPVPIVAEADAGGAPYYLKTSVVDTMNYLFLPSNTDLSSVKIYYTGEITLYNPNTKQTVSYGESTLMELKRGENYIYEYDKETDKYYKHPLYVYAGKNIDSLYIDLVNGDEGLIAINADKEHGEPGYGRLVSAANEAIWTGDISKLAGHGNSSFNYREELNVKNSLNLKLKKKAELVPGSGKIKKWTLLYARFDTVAYDSTGLVQMLAYYSYDALMKADAGYENVCGKYVDVFINGEYRGIYILTERFNNKSMLSLNDSEAEYEEKTKMVTVTDDENDEVLKKGIRGYRYAVTDGKVTVPDDVTGGFVLEFTHDRKPHDGWIATKNGVEIRIKYPENPTREQVQYLACYIQEFEDALFSKTGYNSLGKHYSEYVDMNSLAAHMIVYAFYHNWEYNRISTLCYKDSDLTANGKIVFGPAWDFETDNNYYYYDSVFTSVLYNTPQTYIWTQQLWTHGDFMKYVEVENEEFKNIISTMLGTNIGNEMFVLPELINTIYDSMEMNWLRWKLDSSFKVISDSMVYGLTYRNDTWFKTLWNKDKFLLGVDVKAKKIKNGIKLTAVANGKNNEDFTWYKVDDEDWSEYSIVGVGKTIVVPATGKYFCSVSGSNNAYNKDCQGEIFGSTVITIYSSVYDSENENKTTIEAVKGNSVWNMYYKNSKRFTLLRGESRNVTFFVYYSSIAVILTISILVSIKGKKKKYKR